MSSGVFGSGNGQKHITYQCPHCSRPYKTLRGLNKHQLIHIQAENVPLQNPSNDNNPSTEKEEEVEDSELWPEEADRECIVVESFFERKDEEQEALLLAGVMGLEAGFSAETHKGKKKKISEQKAKTPLALCSACGKSYLTLDGYIKHRVSHAMSDRVAKAPSFEDAKREVERLATEAIVDKLESYPNANTRLEKQHHLSASSMRENLSIENANDFLNSLCVGLYDSFSNGSTFLLPSQLREAYIRGAAILMSDKQKRDELHCKLKAALKCEEEYSDINFFLTTFMRHFSNKFLAFIVHWMVNAKDSAIVNSKSAYIMTKESLDSTDFKQTLHYIGGANVKSVLRCAWRNWGQNDGCKAVITTLRENFIIGGPYNAPDPEFMEWTLCQDRGKLIKINDKALSFFLELAGILKPLEHFDGSLIVEEVIEHLSSHAKIIYLWEELTKETLPKQLSFKLLHSLCVYFCNT